MRPKDKNEELDVEEICLWGGGAINPNLWNYMQRESLSVRIMLLDEAGVSVTTNEAVIFALQVMDAVLGRPLIAPEG